MKGESDSLPSDDHTMGLVSAISIGALIWGFYVKSIKPRLLRQHIQALGVSLRRVKRASSEIERKVFHLCGLLVPLIYQLLLSNGHSKQTCCAICWVITFGQWAFDVTRLCSPAAHKLFLKTPIGKILRENEHSELVGASYFSLGCTLVIQFFKAEIAITAILFLVLGDMSAALIGVSFGGEACVVKLGRGGKKSLEGSVAMFGVCFLVGLFVFSEIRLSEYAVFVGAIVATLTELYEPFWLNDNLTIPVFSALAMQWGFKRLYITCTGEGVLYG